LTVASVTEISAASSEGFEAAIREGIARANRTLHNVEGAWVKDINLDVREWPDKDLQGEPGYRLRPRGWHLR
jgi:flavin-binding protein dodecin